MSSAAGPSSKSGKFFTTLIILALIVLVVVLDMRRREAEKKVINLSTQMEQGNQEQNREAAQKIVQQVRRLFVIPEGVDPTVATIVDVEQLRARNAFYNKAKNGDHLIVTSDRAILYDPIADKIIDVVPVQIQAPAAGAASSKK